MDGTFNDSQQQWLDLCALDEIVPDTGVAARFKSSQIAVFRLRDDRVFAIGNYDPMSDAAVLSRGLVGNLGERVVVASPIYKHHFDLVTGECLEAPETKVPAYLARVQQGRVQVGLPA